MPAASTASSLADKTVGPKGRVNVVKLALELDIPLDALAGAFKKTRRYLQMEPSAASFQGSAAKIVHMVDALSKHLGEKRFALFWLKTPQPEFGDKTPIEYMREGHLELVLGLADDIVMMVPDQVTKAELVRNIARFGKPIRGSFYRSTPLVFVHSPLSAIGSMRKGGRYNPIGMLEILYVAQSRDTVARETRAVVIDPKTGQSISNPRPPSIELTVDVDLNLVVDLTDDDVCAGLAIRSGDLILEWRDLVARKKRVPTHTIGVVALQAGIEALLVPSARLTGSRNLAILLANLRQGSSIEVFSPAGFPPDAQTRVVGTEP